MPHAVCVHVVVEAVGKEVEHLACVRVSRGPVVTSFLWVGLLWVVEVEMCRVRYNNLKKEKTMVPLKVTTSHTTRRLELLGQRHCTTFQRDQLPFRGFGLRQFPLALDMDILRL